MTHFGVRIRKAFIHSTDHLFFSLFLCLFTLPFSFVFFAGWFLLFRFAPLATFSLFALPFDCRCVLSGLFYVPFLQYPWGLGYSACHLKSLIPETTACASILTLVTLTVERYRAICLESNSLRAQTLAPTETIQMKKSVIRNIIGIWIISILAALPVTIFTQINYLTDLNGQILTQSAWCGLPFNSPNQSWEKFMIMSTVAFFIIPLIVMTLLYSLIGQTLRRANRIPNPDFQLTDQSSSRKIMKSRTIVVRLLGEFCISLAHSCFLFFARQFFLPIWTSFFHYNLPGHPHPPPPPPLLSLSLSPDVVRVQVVLVCCKFHV